MGDEQDPSAVAGEPSVADTDTPDVDAAIAAAVAEGEGSAEGAAGADGAGDAAAVADSAAAVDPAAATPAAAAEPPEATRVRRAAAALAEKERGIAVREREIEQQAADLQAFRDAVATAKTDPLGVLERLGIGPDAVLDQLIDRKTKPQPTAEERLAALEQQWAARDARASEEAKAARIAAHKADVIRAVQAGGEKYDLINSLGQHDLVIETIYAYARQFGSVIDADIAAAQVEQYLAGNLARSKKYAARAAAPQIAPAKNKPKTLAGVPAGQVPSTEDDLPEGGRARFSAVLAQMGLTH